MSRKCCRYNQCGAGYPVGGYGAGASPYGCGTGGIGGIGCGSGCCNFPSFIILILILLQFKGHSSTESCGNPCGNSGGIVDKGILFIIALYYLSCCNPCGKKY